MSTGTGFPIFDDEVRDAAFVDGMRLGVERVTATGWYVDIDEVEANLAPLVSALVALDHETPFEPHAISLLSEITATAAAVRLAHEEPALTQGDIEEFLPAALQFFNTYVGCPNPG